LVISSALQNAKHFALKIYGLFHNQLNFGTAPTGLEFDFWEGMSYGKANCCTK
jgi:hypothetical protein